MRGEVIEFLGKKPMPWGDIYGHLLGCGFNKGTVKGVLANMRKNNKVVKEGDEEMYLSGSSPILVVFLKLKRTSNLK